MITIITIVVTYMLILCFTEVHKKLREIIEQYTCILTAVARSYVTGGIIASAEGRSLVGGSGGILPLKVFKFGGSETLFSALVMRYVSEKLTSNMKMANNCKSL